MKKLIIILSIIVASCSSSQLGKNSLVYDLPLSVEKEVFELISQDVNENTLIMSEGNNLYHLHIIVNLSNEDLKKIKLLNKIQISDRKLQINDKLYALILGYDFNFLNQTKPRKLFTIEQREEAM